MARTQTLVQFTPDLLALLDKVAAEREVSRSALIREAVSEYLEVERRKAIDEAYIEGYTRVPQTEEEILWSENRRREAWADLEW